MDKERRFFNAEVRMDNSDQGEQPAKIIGYAAMFEQRSENLGGFREIIMPGAFDDVLSQDVRGLFNHDSNYILGRTDSGTMQLVVDERGLRYEIDAPDTQTIKDLVIEPMKRGDISQSSFTFHIARDGQKWIEDEDGAVIREIHKISRLFDVGPVAIPAYPDTTSASRSLDDWKTQAQQNELEQQKSQAKEQRDFRERVLKTL